MTSSRQLFSVLGFVIFLSFCLKPTVTVDFIPTDPLFTSQWYISNKDHPSADINAPQAWNRHKASGRGVTVAVIDNYFDILHDDLLNATVQSLSRNFVDDSANVSPSKSVANAISSKGTSLAGMVLARTNEVAAIGLAYNAFFAPLTVAHTIKAEQIAAALVFEKDRIQIYCNTWMSEDGFGYKTQIPDVISNALEEGVTTGRAGKGNIYVFPAGSSYTKTLGVPESTNFDGYANNPYTITVGALTRTGYPGTGAYHNPGLSIMGVVPASSSLTDTVVRKVAISWDSHSSSTAYHTIAFTSRASSAALVSGIAALILEVNPRLTWLDVQNILITTARKVNPSDSEWTTLSSGLKFNRKYGFGIFHAPDALALAETYTHQILPSPAYLEHVTTKSEEISNDAEINAMYLGKGSPYVYKFTEQSDFSVAHVQLELTINYPDYSADFEISLTSPNGVVSQFASTAGISRSLSITKVNHPTIASLSVTEAPFGPKYRKGATTFDGIAMLDADGDNPYGCLPIIGTPFDVQSNTLLLLEDTSKCSYDVIAIHAQTHGARGVIFISQTDVSMPMPAMDKAVAATVTIPVIMIDHTLGAAMMDYLQHNHKEPLSIKVDVASTKVKTPPYKNFSFMSYMHWKERSRGVWTLVIRDNDPYEYGLVGSAPAVLQSSKLRLFKNVEHRLSPVTPSPLQSTLTPAPQSTPQSPSPNTPSPSSTPTTTPLPPLAPTFAPESSSDPVATPMSTGTVVAITLLSFVGILLVILGGVYLYVQHRKPEFITQPQKTFMTLEEDEMPESEEKIEDEEEVPEEYLDEEDEYVE